MPKNFQTSQYDEPIAFNGWLDVELEDGSVYRVEIERAHMEEDTGKTLHMGGATGRIHGADHSLVDYNRAGIPLIEIVTKPMTGVGDRAPEIARAYVGALRELLRALEVSDVRMEQGSLRCDANVSLRPRLDDEQESVPLGTRTETKNVNSLRSVERAVRYEITRQAAILRGGGADRAGDAALARGHRRHDVRAREERRHGLPVLPGARPRAGRPVVRAGGGPAADPARAPRGAAQAAPDRLGLHAISRCATSSTPARSRSSRRPSPRVRRPPARASGGAARWPGGPTPRAWTSASTRRRPASPRRTSPSWTGWSTSGRLNDSMARQVLDGVLAGEGTPTAVADACGLEMVSDDSALEAAVDAVIAANPDVAEKVRDGKVQAAGALIGQVMKQMKGQADAAKVREIVLAKLTP